MRNLAPSTQGFFGPSSESTIGFNQNQDFYNPTPSNVGPQGGKKEGPKASFKPPSLVERFSVPVVEPSIPFSPPEAMIDDKPALIKEHDEFSEFSAPEPPRYAPTPGSLAPVPPYANQQNKPKNPVKKSIGGKKPVVPEHKYEQKNYRKPVMAPNMGNQEHPIMRVKPGQERPPAEYRSADTPVQFKNAFRRIDGPKLGYAPQEPLNRPTGKLEIEEVRRQKPAEYRSVDPPQPQPIQYDNSQEIITLDQAKRFTSDSGQKTFTVKASFSPSLNPQDLPRTARTVNRRTGSIPNIRIKHRSPINKKRQRFIRRN